MCSLVLPRTRTRFGAAGAGWPVTLAPMRNILTALGESTHLSDDQPPRHGDTTVNTITIAGNRSISGREFPIEAFQCDEDNN